MQHILIKWLPVEEGNDMITIVEPVDASIWRDDRLITWMLVDPPDEVGWEVSSGAVVMAEQWTTDGGLAPMPLGDPPESGPDRRMNIAMGPPPLPLTATEAVTYSYDLMLPPVVE